MTRVLRDAIRSAMAGLFGSVLLAAASESLIAPEFRVAPDAPEWRELVERFARKPDVTANFEESRVFPFRAEPVVLRGEVRVSGTKGLSLHYTAPQERTIILDADGMLVRETAGQKTTPVDPRANAANEALRHILRLDFAKLAESYELYGRREGEAWSLVLVPRDAGTRRAIGNIHVAGSGETVRQIELRRSAKQHIDITMSEPRPVTFTAEELKRYFR
jgi:hypothetical protein